MPVAYGVMLPPYGWQGLKYISFISILSSDVGLLEGFFVGGVFYERLLSNTIVVVQNPGVLSPSLCNINQRKRRLALQQFSN